VEVARHDNAVSVQLCVVYPFIQSVGFETVGRRRAGECGDVLWEVPTDGAGLQPLLLNWHHLPAECRGTWTPDGRYYLFPSSTTSGADLWASTKPVAAYC
jgi:hypothetical protein